LLQALVDALQAEGARRLATDGFAPHRRTIELTAMARYLGQSSEIPVALAVAPAHAMLAALPEAFATAHERLYGFRAPAGEVVEITGISLLARGTPEQARLPQHVPPRGESGSTTRLAWFAGEGWLPTKVLSRAGLSSNNHPGPLLIQEYDATCLVPPGASARLDQFGNILIRLTEL
jgi:N-methylhydantoinase A